MSIVDKNCATIEFYTPPRLVEPVRAYARSLGYDGIELDPAAPEHNPTGAKRHFTAADDGLRRSWNTEARSPRGTFVFVNPPYGTALRTWVPYIRRQAEENCVVALLPGQRFEQPYWQRNLFDPTATRAICAVKGRVSFLGRLCARCGLWEGGRIHTGEEDTGARLGQSKKLRRGVAPAERKGAPGLCNFEWSGRTSPCVGNPYGSFYYFIGGGHQAHKVRQHFCAVGMVFGLAWVEQWEDFPLLAGQEADGG